MPEYDDVETKGMSPLKKVVNGEQVDDIRSVQLNEKISDKIYQILHPETDAYQVITDPNRRFVSEAEKDKWNKAYSLGASALHYKGEWKEGTSYHNYDLVYLKGSVEDADNPYPNVAADGGRRFFIYLNDRNESALPEGPGVEANNGNKPHYDEFISANNTWINVNFESFLSEFANMVRVEATANNTYNFALVDGNGKYVKLTSSSAFIVDPINRTIKIGIGETQIVIDGKNGTVKAVKFIGDLEGTATDAEHAKIADQYTIYQRDGGTRELILDADGNRQPLESKPFIDDAFTEVHKRIDAITDGTGGAVLSNGLHISKNGESLLVHDPFTGKYEENVDITFTPEEIKGLLNDDKQKIQDHWLPDTILGAMSYVGTFDPATGQMKTDLRDPVGRPFRKGDYAIAVTEGNLDPSGKTHTPDTEEGAFFLVGDWAVYSGDVDADGTVDAEEWTKIDNTDAVRTVNEQVGNVKTYKGIWTGNTQYYAGDIVEFGTPAAMYLCVKTNNDAEFSETNFKVFGRVYKAADGIELTEKDNTFRHLFKDAATTTAEKVLAPKEKIVVSNIVLQDKYGHVKSNTVTTYQLPDDTWRNVKVNGAEIQDTSVTSGPLDINHDLTDEDRRVAIEADTKDPLNPKIIVKHVAAKGGKGKHISEVLGIKEVGSIKIGLGSQFTAPTFEWNKEGHVDSYSKVVFELPEDLVQHKHFNVVLENGRSMIRSYTADEFIALDNKARKFYDEGADGMYVPISTDKMGFDGGFVSKEFFQTGRLLGSQIFRVLDESLTTSSGNNYLGNDIIGVYDDKRNRMILGDSGIHTLETPVVYSAIAINKKGIAVAGGQILEFGSYNDETGESSDPTDALVIGGLFFRNVGPKRDNNGIQG